MNIDETLRQALRRESPPDGFRNRVMRRIPAAAPREKSRGPWRVAAALMLLASGAIGAVTLHRIERQREGERARQQVMLALRIAGQKVHYARSEVRDTLKGTSE